MPVDSPSPFPPPREEYSRRFEQAQERRERQQRRERRIGYSQLLISAVSVGWLLWLLRHWSKAGFWVLVPICLFIVLAFVQERLIRSVRYTTRLAGFYERGLQRLNDCWAGTGETGERFLDPSHPYARDLDLFGKASLFELLSTARTRAGEETLARWLLSTEPIEEIRRRQAATLDLKERLAFRETLFALGEDHRAAGQPGPLAGWGEASPLLASRPLRIAAPLLAALWVFSVVCWGLWGNLPFLVGATLVNLGVSRRYSSRLRESAHAVEVAGRDLGLLSLVLAAFERESFTSSKLVELQARLKHDGIAPSAAIARLNRLVEYLDSADNLFVRLLDPVVFWSLQCTLAIESWRARFGPAIRGWIDSMGELEALVALSGYAYEHPEDTFPKFIEHGPCFRAEAFAHPLLPAKKAVRNDLELGAGCRLIILSGPNMAGKSTFLRSIGVNVVLAQCGAPVRAVRLQLSPLAVTASICILDSLEGGVSRFYAEIHRLKQIVDLTRGPLPVLFLLDELLSGTNSHDRLIGTQSIVRRLIEENAIGLVTTHDLALTAIPEALGPSAANCHFADHLENGELRFDYKLRTGVVQTSNALGLMRSIGLEI